MSASDLDRLAGQLLKIAKDRLAELGQFHPFAAVVQTDGSVAQLAYNPPGRAPVVAAFLDALKDKIRDGARDGQFRAAAVCLLAQAHCPPDKRVSEAVCIQLHDDNGESIGYYAPFTRDKQGSFAWAEPFRTPGPASLFPERDSPAESTASAGAASAAAESADANVNDANAEADVNVNDAEAEGTDAKAHARADDAPAADRRSKPDLDA